MKYVLAIALLFASLCYAGEKPALEGYPVLGKGECHFPPNHGYCFLVQKDADIFVALHDQDGQKAIYKMKDATARPAVIEPKDLELVWERQDT